jgi:hypothetical protein
MAGPYHAQFAKSGPGPGESVPHPVLGQDDDADDELSLAQDRMIDQNKAWHPVRSGAHPAMPGKMMPIARTTILTKPEQQLTEMAPCA